MLRENHSHTAHTVTAASLINPAAPVIKVRNNATGRRKTVRMSLSTGIILLVGLFVILIIMVFSFHLYWKHQDALKLIEGSVVLKYDPMISNLRSAITIDSNTKRNRNRNTNETVLTNNNNSLVDNEDKDVTISHDDIHRSGSSKSNNTTNSNKNNVKDSNRNNHNIEKSNDKNSDNKNDKNNDKMSVPDFITLVSSSEEEKKINLLKPYTVSFIISINHSEKGQVIIEIHPKWAPLGAARFRELIEIKYFTGNRFFRAIKGFMNQFGICGDPLLQEQFTQKFKGIKDDPVRHSNDKGTISFASSGPNSRKTQLFINTAIHGNKYLDDEGFSPIGKIISGMGIVDQIYTGYGEGGRGDGTDGNGPSQFRMVSEGNEYLDKYFPLLSYIEDTSFI